MARQLRVEYPGAIYHVMSRGDHWERIFRDDADRRTFLEAMTRAGEKTGWQVHAYCLMPDHFHLVVETPRGNLVAGMKWLLGTYTGQFNRRHDECGHLFSGRYKSLLVDGTGNGYLRTVCNYVHLNPVRAKLLPPKQPLESFVWSSYGEYLKGPAQRFPWLRVDRLLTEMGIAKDSPAGRKEFGRKMEDQRGAKENFAKIRRGWCFGDAKFRRESLAMASTSGRPDLPAEIRREAEAQKAERIIAEEMARLEWPEKHLAQSRKGAREKVNLAFRLRRETTVSVGWIAERLRMGARTYATNLLLQAAKKRIPRKDGARKTTRQ
jgi:putative transposase